MATRHEEFVDEMTKFGDRFLPPEARQDDKSVDDYDAQVAIRYLRTLERSLDQPVRFRLAD